MREIRITKADYMFAAYAGFLRRIRAQCGGMKHKHGFKGDAWEKDVLGAVGEYVAAKAYGLYWPGPGEVGGKDVGGAYQVRTRKHPDFLGIIQKDDNPDDVFIVVCKRSIFAWVVKGWIRARDAQREEFLQDLAKNDRPAYFVPDEALDLGPLPPPAREALPCGSAFLSAVQSFIDAEARGETRG
jgi:hypothetical protein